jgi:DNA-binding transcriptional ArsR family regulator
VVIADVRASSVVQLLAEPTRASMCAALLGGEALTAGELARAAGVAPSTATGHLTRMTSGGMISVAQQGRHRYYRLAGTEIAELVEHLVSPADPAPVRSLHDQRRQTHLRLARTCYDHLAGAIAVHLANALVDMQVLANDADTFHPTDRTQAFFADLGIDLTGQQASRRPLVRSCLDWTERRPHLAGRLGAALLDHLVSEHAITRQRGTRAIKITNRGRDYLTETFKIPPRLWSNEPDDPSIT